MPEASIKRVFCSRSRAYRRKEERMDKDEVCALLVSRGIEFEYAGHNAVYDMADVSAAELPHPEAEAKCLFLCSDRHDDHCLVCIKGDRRFDTKAFRRAYGKRHMSFASPEETKAILGLEPGSVSPFGLLNDAGRRTGLYIDGALFEGEGLIAAHPNTNTATVWLKTGDLAALMESIGFSVTVMPEGL